MDWLIQTIIVCILAGAGAGFGTGVDFTDAYNISRHGAL